MAMESGIIDIGSFLFNHMPGDNVSLEIELITPIAMEKELRFAIREGGHTVGAGVVTEVLT